MSVASLARQNMVCIPVDSVQEEVVQLRTEYLEEPLEELSDSLEGEGILQPIVVARAENGIYELIIGSRRLRAAKRNQQPEILAIVIEAGSPLSYLLMALAENLHREDLNAFEEARAFLRLMKDYGLTLQEVARQTRKREHYIRHRIELLSLPEDVQAMIASKILGLQFVQGLAKLPSGEDQVYFARKVVSDRLNQAELRAIVTRELGGGSEPRLSRQQPSAEKVRIKVDMFAVWLDKMPKKAAIKKMNVEERIAIANSLNELEIRVRTARHLFTSGKAFEPVARPRSAGNLTEAPRNSGGEWPSGDLDKIMATDRPSDEELGRMLGRTVPAIRAMRQKLQDTKQKKAG